MPSTTRASAASCADDPGVHACHRTQGEDVYRTNEVSKKMYFIKAGIVETWVMITTGGVQEEETKRISQPGETIGDLAFLFDLRHAHNARVSKRTPGVLLELAKSDFKELVVLFPEQVNLQHLLRPEGLQQLPSSSCACVSCALRL